MHDPDAPEHQAVERELGDRYQIVRTLGRGAFGAVYLARERQLHRLVAVKVVRADAATQADERARLLREARTLANLSHPAIVPLLAFGDTERLVYLVMPYVGGETLADRLARAAAEEGDGATEARYGRLPPAEARRVLTEIADALAYAHGEGVLHRDLKPENVLLERAGAVGDDVPPRVRLIDFGVAAFHTRDPGAGARRDEGYGTPRFMAPEQLLGEPELDPRSELYALGVIGYLLLGGRLPFAAASPAARLAEQQRGPAPRLGALAPLAPPDLVAAVERCLAYDPAGRWPRARDLRDALVRGAANDGPAAAAADARAALRRAAPRARPRTPAEWRARAAAWARETLAAGLAADVRFAARTLRKAPAFTAAVVFTLALGIGATTAVFSVVEALLLRPPPVADPGSLVALQERRRGQQSTDFGTSTLRYDRYLAYRAAAGGAFAGLAAQTYRPVSARATDAGRGGARAVPRSAHALVTSDNYFTLLGLRPALGRFYAAGGTEPAVVVSDAFWRAALGGDPKVVGRTLVVDGRPLTVVGVAPPGFQGALATVFAFDLWVPAAAYPWPAPDGGPPLAGAALAGPDAPSVNVFGRLRPGVDSAAAHAALRVAGARVPAERADIRFVDAWAEPLGPLPGELRTAAGRFLGVLLGFAGVVLLIAAANAAGLLLARAVARRREVAARLAVGASRARLVRQLLVESTLLCGAAGALGVLIAWGAARGLRAWQPPLSIPTAVGYGVDGRVLAVAAAAVLGTALLAGLAPAAQATRVELATAMKDAGLHGGPRRTRLRDAFVVAQVALSVVLLAVGGLFGRALQQASAVDPGFRAAGVVHAVVDVGPLGYDDARTLAFIERLRGRLLRRREVAAAAFAASAPLSGNVSWSDTRRPDQPDARAINVQWSSADVGFVELLGTPLLAGRTFTAADGPTAPRVTLVNATLARRLWPGEPPASAVGRRIARGEDELTVVGVLADGRYALLGEAPQSFAYAPFAQRVRGPVLYLRARGGAAGDGEAGTAAALRAAREELAALAPDVALHRPTLLTDDVGRYRVPQQAGTLVVGAFGLLGLVLAATGLYSVLAYGVAQRLREFGVRMALGAPGGAVARLVVRRGLLLVAAGAALGLAGALAAGRVVASFLFGVSPADPLTLLAAPIVLAAAALAAALGPARRAAAADPMAALRAE